MGHHHRSSEPRRLHLRGLHALATAALIGLCACSSGSESGLGPDGGHGGGGGGGGIGGGGGGTIRPGGNGQGLTQPIKFDAVNYHSTSRIETVRASIPFPEGLTTSLATYGVKGMQNAWYPLQYWPDGSIRMAQAQFTDTFAANETKTYEIVQNVTPLTGSFKPNPWIQQFRNNIRIGARVRDTLNVPYEAEVTGTGQILQETPLVRVSRHRLYHYATQSPNIGRDYLTSTFYLTEFQDTPFVIVDWILGNDYLGADDTTGKSPATDPNYFPLGAIDVKTADFMVRGVTETQAYLAAKHAVGPGTLESSGWTTFRVMDNTSMADGMTRRYRFLIRMADTNATPAVLQQWKNSFDAAVANPLWALAGLQAWQETGGMGLHGGPITGPADAMARAQGDYNSWNGGSWFGTWGTFGDVKYSNTTGTPRNAPMSEDLAHAAQSGYLKLLQVLEQKAWAQAPRPYHLFGLKVGTLQNLLLWEEIPFFPGGRGLSPETLGRKAVWTPDKYPGYRKMVNFSEIPPSSHGWNGFDHEHWTTDLLFDYWSVTGDEWAKEEIRQLGESLKGLMRLQTFATAGMQAARAEGWCMTGWVHAYLATGDPTFKSYALARVNNIVNPQRPGHPSKAFMIQGGHPLTGYPNPHSFFMPWQHAPVIFGYVAASRFFEDPLCLKIAEDVPTMVEYSWVTNFNDPTFGFVGNGLRYYVPTHYNGSPIPANYWDNTPGIGVKWGCGPLGGAHGFLVGALHVLAARTQDATVQAKALYYGNIILGNISPNKRWYKWNLTVDEAFLP